MAARHKHKKAVPFPSMEQVPPVFMLLLLQCPDECLALRALQERRQGIHDLLVILEGTLAQDGQSRRFIMAQKVLATARIRACRQMASPCSFRG